MAGIFKRISLYGARLEYKKREKRGENLLFWRSHSFVDRDLQKKKRSSPCFPISVRPAASTVFPNLALRVKSLPTPVLDRCVVFRSCIRGIVS